MFSDDTEHLMGRQRDGFPGQRRGRGAHRSTQKKLVPPGRCSASTVMFRLPGHAESKAITQSHILKQQPTRVARD